MRGAPSRFTGTFSSSATVAAISAPNPAACTDSCTTSSLPVLRTEANTVSLSHGQSVRRSMISTDFALFASSAAWTSSTR
jgi:hypothetical protein